MNFRQKITLSLLLTVVLGSTALAQVVDFPDPNLRAAVRNELNLSTNVPITQDDMDRLKHLSAYHSDIINLSGLEFATQLEELILGGNPASDLHPITGLTELRLLILPCCQISDLSPLSGLRQLVELNVRENPISDLSPLVGLTELKYLDLGHCLIVDFSPLLSLENLYTLQLNDNQIMDVSLISQMTSLRKLELHGNQISDIRPLSTLTSLEHLELQHNQISDIRPLSTLTSLEHLELQHNQISDVRPLSTLTSLRFLNLQRNKISDYTPVDSLSLDTFIYDQVCEMPPLPLEPRLENKKYPSIASAFSGYGWPPVQNRPDLSDAENIALHDLWIHGDEFGIRLSDINNTIVLSGNLDEAIRRREELRTLNPNQVILMAYSYAAAHMNEFPEVSPYWIRSDDGTIFRPYDPAGFLAPFHGLIDFTLPDIQDRIVKWAVAVSKCGLYDGIHFDTWSEEWPILVGFDINGVFHQFRSLEAERRARLNIVQRIRAQTRANFLITGNTNDNIIPLTGPYMSGGYMEGGWPEDDNTLITLKNTLTWHEVNLREPRIIVLEGKTLPNEPRDSPTNLQWVRVLTTLSLTHSDGYVSHNNPHDQRRDWYEFWDADLGRPIGPKAQLYDESIPELFIREFTNGWAVFNRSGEEQVITLPEEVQGVASGSVNTEHTLPNLDGEIYLKKTAPMDSPDINGSDIYITNSIRAVPGAALLLDASNNPGSTVHWVNLGSAEGRLPASDRLPTVEEGEIEIPAIGFSSRRRYYTATASGQTFGGPVHFNPQLYLGDWTLEFLCKRNGDLFSLEHQFAGFQNSPRERLQGIRLWLPNDGQELGMSIHADGFKQPERTLNIFLEKDVWTWVTIVSINGESIIAYQDGVEASRHPGVHFDVSLPLDDISIGSNSYGERHRNFNGSFSIVCVYDRALSPDEVLQNIGATVIPIPNPADVNGDGAVNILDLVAVAQAFGEDGLQGDVNGDGVVNVFDLVFVAGAIGGGGAAPPAHSLDLSIISAGDVERWLALAGGLGVGDGNFQRGIRFLEGLLAALTPKETALLPNYPNPFNPETWIPYRLARGAEVAITIYDTKGTPVRRLALGNQAAGYYTERGKAAYWDGRNEDGQAVASGIYIYQFRAGDYAASRRMVIVK